jgi:hypothetical protein
MPYVILCCVTSGRPLDGWMKVEIENLMCRVIQKSLCTCKNTNTFLMVNLRLQHGTVTRHTKVICAK